MTNQAMLDFLIFALLYSVFIFAPMFTYVRTRKVPSSLKKYKKVTIPNKGMNIKEIADKLLTYNLVIKVRIEDDKLIFQDKLSLSSVSWGKMYIITAEEDRLTIYYRNALGIYTSYKKDLREMKDFIELIVC